MGRLFSGPSIFVGGSGVPVRCARASTSNGKVAIHRLRKRFREIVKLEIAQTVNGADEQQAELRHLIAALAVESAVSTVAE